jgi:hypothetical protein
MTKAELAQAIEALTGKPVNPDSFTKVQLEQMLAEAQAEANPPGNNQAQEPAANPSAADKPAEPAADEPTVRVRLGEDAPVAALVIGNARIERDSATVIKVSDFERFESHYKLEVVK